MDKFVSHWSINLIMKNSPVGIIFAAIALISANFIMPDKSSTVITWRFQAPSVPYFYHKNAIDFVCFDLFKKLIETAPKRVSVKLGNIDSSSVEPDDFGIMEVCTNAIGLNMTFEFEGQIEDPEKYFTIQEFDQVIAEFSDSILDTEAKLIEDTRQLFNETMEINDSKVVPGVGLSEFQKELWKSQSELAMAESRMQALKARQLNVRVRRDQIVKTSSSLIYGPVSLAFLIGFLLSMLIRQIFVPFTEKKES